MEIIKGYFDYCVSESCVFEEDFDQTTKLLYDLGYKTIAINQVLLESSLETRKKKKKGEPRDVIDVVPPPIDVKKYEDNSKLKILNRLTVVFSNQDIFNKITKSVNYKKYHIIALIPLSQGGIQYACNKLEFEILSFDPVNKISYKLSRKIYNQLVEKGVHFEILYSPAILDSTQRKNMIHVSHLYHSFGKSRNIIVSSGANRRILFRSPYDIINLGMIFGLNEEQCKNSILHCGRNVFLYSMGRRRGKTLMSSENVEDNAGVKKEEVEEESSEVEDIEMDGPALKKPKQ